MKMHRKHTFDRRQWGHEILEKNPRKFLHFICLWPCTSCHEKKHGKQCWKMFRALFEGRTHVIKSLVGFVKWWVNRPCGYILVVDGRIGEMVERKPSRQRGFLFCTRVAFKHGLDWQIKNTDSLQSIVGILLVGPGQCRTLLDPYSFIPKRTCSYREKILLKWKWEFGTDTAKFPLRFVGSSKLFIVATHCRKRRCKIRTIQRWKRVKLGGNICSVEIGISFSKFVVTLFSIGFLGWWAKEGLKNLLK